MPVGVTLSLLQKSDTQPAFAMLTCLTCRPVVCHLQHQAPTGCAPFTVAHCHLHKKHLRNICLQLKTHMLAMERNEEKRAHHFKLCAPLGSSLVILLNGFNFGLFSPSLVIVRRHGLLRRTW